MLIKTDRKPPSDNWFTPKEIIEPVREWYGGVIDYDPASCVEANKTIKARAITTIKDTGTSAALVRPWGFGGTREGKIWCNPPYLGKGVVESWVRKAEKEFQVSNGELEILMLLNRSDANWYQDFIDNSLYLSGYYQFRKRISFINGDTCTKSSPRYNNDLLYWGGCEKRDFRELCKEFGKPAVSTMFYCQEVWWH